MHRRNRKDLIDGIARLRLDLPGNAVDLLVRYCEEIALWNRKMNLVGGGERDLVVRHVLDSLASIPVLFPEGGRRPASAVSIADVGSGAGLPGIPLAIALPECPVALIERSERRVSFLTTVKLLLSLSSVTIVEEDAATHAGWYDYVLCRAYLPYDRAIPSLARLTLPRGAVVFFAALPPEPVSDEEGLLREDHRLTVPFLEAPRTLVVLRRDTTR